MPHIPLIFIIAGEASGDQLGAELMADLKQLKDVRFAGIGGPAMRKQGLTSLFPMEELSVMGIGGILSQLPHLLRRLRYTVKTIQYLQPDAVVTIDAQEFSFRVLKRIHKFPSRPRLIHYVAPTVWAWRPGRARKISAFVDRLLCLYPFEPPYFEKYGLRSIFVGHPVAKELMNNDTPPERHNNEQRDPNLLCLLPGSRKSEINTLLPIFGKTVELLQQDIPSLKVMIPTLSALKESVEQEIQKWPNDVQVVVGDQARQAVFQKASVALAASGTVALQLAAAGLPCVIAYKVGKLNEWIGKVLLKTPWVCMINILLTFHTLGSGFILNRKTKAKIKEIWIPELLQNACNPKNLKTELIKLLKNPKALYHQQQAMREAIAMLKAAPQIAAKNILEEINIIII